MTAIAGLIDGTDVWLGGDSALTCAYTMALTLGATPKVYTRESVESRPETWGFGFAGSVRLAQVVRYEMDLPLCTAEDAKDMDKFMVKDFIDLLRQASDKAGHTRRISGQESAHNAQLMVAFRGHLWTVYSDWQIERSVYPYAAIGIGFPYALGSLHASSYMEPTEGRPTLPRHAYGWPWRRQWHIT